jgi:hypothetical protein
LIIQGIAHWAKIVGDPQPGYDKTQKEWSLDLEIDEATIEKLKEVGLGHKVKTSKGDSPYTFIQFKRKALKKDQATGQMVPAKPIKIVDAQKRAWDETLIGNGSLLNVSFMVNEVPYNGRIHLKPGIVGVQVVKLVEYEGREDFEEYPVDDDGNEDWSQDD